MLLWQPMPLLSFNTCVILCVFLGQVNTVSQSVSQSIFLSLGLSIRSSQEPSKSGPSVPCVHAATGADFHRAIVATAPGEKFLMGRGGREIVLCPVKKKQSRRLYQWRECAGGVVVEDGGSAV